MQVQVRVSRRMRMRARVLVQVRVRVRVRVRVLGRVRVDSRGQAPSASLPTAHAQAEPSHQANAGLPGCSGGYGGPGIAPQSQLGLQRSEKNGGVKDAIMTRAGRRGWKR